jgi:hypothetical protein
MCDLDSTDRNVVPLRRGGGPDEEERRRLASTIFAEPDEIGTFSQGNLVPPPSQSPDEEGRQPDPFFEDRLPRAADSGVTPEAPGAGTVADDYFAQLSQQSASEMADGLRERHQPVTAMPGSAQLPDAPARVPRLARPSQPRRRARAAFRRQVAISSSSVLLLCGAALALVLTSRTPPPGAPIAGSPPQIASVLDFERSPLSLSTDQSSPAATGTGSRHTREHQTSRSRKSHTARTSRNQRWLGSRRIKSQPAARPRPSSQGSSGQRVTTANEPTSAEAVSTSSSSGEPTGTPATTDSSPTVTSTPSSADSTQLPAGPTGIGSASGCNPKCS